MDSRDLALYNDERLLSTALDMMKALGFETGLNLSLKNSLSKIEEHFDTWQLHSDFANARTFYREQTALLLDNCDIKFRIKAPASIDNKLLRAKLAQQKGVFRPFEKVMNDLIGLRIVVSDYSSVRDSFALKGDQYKIVDMSDGKALDDGYRGIHIYWQQDHRHYPVELQVMTERDRVFNNWLHEHTYKIRGREDVGSRLRQLYDKNVIKSKKDFEESLDVLLDS